MKKDFYIYKCLREIHSLNQAILQEQRKFGLLLILNTPGSLEHYIVHTDPDKLQSIFDNLLFHALLFNDSGSIEFGYKLGKDDRLKFYVIEPIRPGPDLFTIEEETEAVYNLVSNIMEIVPGLGGNIWIGKLPGHGKTFWFTLDIQPKNSGRKEEPRWSTDTPKVDWTGRTILIVDDVSTNRLLLEGYLKPTRASIISVENGLQAVNVVKKNNSIECVLMDVRMPVLDGYEATRRIKRIKPWLPVIAISAYPDSQEFEKWKRAGCNAFLGKPINTNDLTSTISSLIENVTVQA